MHMHAMRNQKLRARRDAAQIELEHYSRFVLLPVVPMCAYYARHAFKSLLASRIFLASPRMKTCRVYLDLVYVCGSIF